MKQRIKWKAIALEAIDRADKAEAYAFDYGNASGACASGYLQQRGLICHHCNHDNSFGKPCPVAAKKKKKEKRRPDGG